MTNPKKMQKNRYIILTVAFLAAFLFIAFTTVWAGIGGVDPHTQVSLSMKKDADLVNFHSDEARNNTARAPEPSTMALFGGGLIGMIISFVRRTYMLAKRCFDIVLALIAIVLLSPLFLFTAILIKLTSPGPVLFKQIRVGKDGEVFEIFKFRTMRVDAEKISGPVWAKENDPRLIPVGKFLRKAHIDEIPQFFNVLRGEMSVVGPRPERPIFVEKLKLEIPDYERRLEVKPGITGLAQVWHRYDETIEDVRKKIKYDILYIKRVCLWTDIRILFRTVRVVLTGEGAR